ncbi:MAG: PAS domain S-box protein [Pseudomonadota bacterium]
MTVRFRFLDRVACWTVPLLLLCVCYAYAAKLTDEERAYLKTKGRIVFVSQTRYPPFEFVDTQGRHEGMTPDVVRRLAVEMGFQPVFTDMSFQKAQEAVLSGKADVLTSLFYSDKRNERFEFTDTLFQVPASIFVQAERTDINNPSNLNGKTIAMQAGDYAKEFLESKGIRFEVLETKDFGEAADMVVAGKADALVGDEQIVLYHIFSNRLTKHLKKIGDPLYIGKNCMAGTKANALLIRILNKGVEEARQAGVLDEISKKWLGTPYGPHELWISRYWWPLSIVAACILLLSLWVWIWNIRLRTAVRRATAEMRGTVSLLQSTLESTADGILVVDREGRITAFNKRFQEMWSVPDEVMEPGHDAKALDNVLTSLKAPEDFLKTVQELYTEPGTESFDVIEFKDGRTFERVSRPQKRDGEIVGRVWNFRDVTDRRKTEEALRESEERYRLLSDYASVGIWQMDQNDVTIFANPAMCELLEIEKAEELVGKTFHEFFTQESIEIIRHEHGKRLEGKSSSYEVQIWGNRGSQRTVTVSGAPLFSASGTLEGTIGCFIDTTDLKRAQEALKESEQRLAQIIEFLPDAFFAIDRNGRVTTWNLAMERLTGVKAYEILGKGDYEYALPFYGERRPVLIDLVINRDKPTEDRYVFVREEGDNILVSETGADTLKLGGRSLWNTARPLYDDQGELIGSIEVIRDITDRKNAEEALRKSEEHYRNFFDNALLGLFRARLSDGVFMEINAKGAQQIGLPAEEIVGRLRTADLYRSPDLLRELVAKLAREGEVQGEEAELRLSDGRRAVFALSARAYPDEGFAEGAILDITDRKNAEEALRASEERFRSVMDASLTGVFVAQDTVFTYVNPEMARLFGYAPEEMVGKLGPPDMVIPEQQEMLRDRLRSRHRGVPGEPYEFKGLRKDGTAFDGLVYPTPITLMGRPAAAGTIMDITETKRLERQLHQAQKLEALGTLAGGVAHDFNNLLQVILGYSDMMLLTKNKQDPDYKRLLTIRQTAKDGAELVKGLLAFARKARIDLRPLNLNQVVERVREMLSRTIPKMIEIDLDLAHEVKTINADPGQMEQILLNLAINARDAMPEGGTLIIETKNVVLEEEYANTHLDVKSGEYVLLSISDNGHGMEKEVLNKVFEPFFTTKEVGKGTGLGLATVFGIVKTHGGHITCYSEPGMGTTFKIYLPVLSTALEPDVEMTAEMTAFGTETILLVDDEERLRDMGEMMLAQFGYKVLTAGNGKEALEVYRLNKDHISLVILDLIMPEMGGKQCLEQLLKIDPTVRAIIASGYSMNGVSKDALQGGAVGFISKPYEAKAFLREVRNALDKG